MAHIERFADPARPGAGAADVGTVIERMRVLRSDWPPQDGVAVFNQVYLTVTETIGALIGDGGFADREAASTLDVRFAANRRTSPNDKSRLPLGKTGLQDGQGPAVDLPGGTERNRPPPPSARRR